MSLYRKHRPQKFSEIVGQEHIKKVLTNALRQDRIGHAYLFSGPRGTGKTTMARLLAKALNCNRRQKTKDKGVLSSKSSVFSSFEPCNECISCAEITGDRSMDVIEIDAASNRGIDEIRELRDKVRYAPSSSRYKVYILDEVHMLTKEAFNALLKTLEEPPKHAIFIMATTELHRVPDTILSRTQQFDFKRASEKELVDNLQKIIKAEQLLIQPAAIKLIARAGDGSFRDSISILDQVAAIDEKEILLSHIQEILGLVPQNILEDFLQYLEKNQAKEAINLINQTYQQGYDLAQFNQIIIEALRQKMLQTGDYSLLAKIKKFIAAGQEMKYAQIPQIPLELAVIESYNMEHVTCNEETEKQKNKKTPVEEQKTKDLRPKTEELRNRKTEVVKVEKLNHKSEIINLKSKWPEVVEVVAAENHSLSLLLKESQPLKIEDEKLHLRVKFKFYAERISAPDKYQILTTAIEKVFGNKYAVECVVQEERLETGFQPQTQDSSSNLINDALEVFGK